MKTVLKWVNMIDVLSVAILIGKLQVVKDAAWCSRF